MKFYGMQKMTLLDYPGYVACTLFTGGCNFRCPFCHNALLVLDLDENYTIPEEEVLAFLKKRQGLLDGVCVTGGEPLINKDIGDFLSKVKELGFKIKLDTNGTNPALLKELVSQKLVDYVAVDIKNSPEKYAETVGLKSFDMSTINETVNFLMNGCVDYEFRTTVTKQFHTEKSMEEAARFIRGAKRYFLQNFVDSGNLIGSGITGQSKEEMEKLLSVVKKYVPDSCLRGI
ncbi:MAG: anaerobic ribonucleoside-triphosphate reductase activating protein [Firmicutes bacterium]|nr:anaerobic ribonucleoside-triphosphate reductase activating protein [Bacillota bacterium]